jgi:hypothetical protein
MTGEQLPLLVVGGIALLALLLGLWQLQVTRRLRREIGELRKQLVDPPVTDDSAPVNFSTSLDSAERQQLQSTPVAAPRNSADKYRFVGALADQGLDADGIAEALQMPTAEVEQLLQLAKLRQAVPAK